MFVALFGAMTFGTFTAYDYYTISQEEIHLLKNVEAISNPEPGGGSGSDDSWKGKRLKTVSCTCSNGKSGTTLHCKTDGDLEPCTETQQGSNACYKVGLSGMKLC